MSEPIQQTPSKQPSLQIPVLPPQLSQNIPSIPQEPHLPEEPQKQDSKHPNQIVDQPKIQNKEEPEGSQIKVSVMDKMIQNEPHIDLSKIQPNNFVDQIQEEKEDGKENEEGQDDEEKDDDRGKSVRKGSSDSIRQSHQDNDTSQPLATIGGKKCFNKLCPSKKIHKKIRSKVQPQRYRFLCRNCYQNYVGNSFCQFCEQIYSNYQNEQEDLNKWVGCDKCQRWNHIECEKKYRDKNFEISSNTNYECLACSKKTGGKNGPAEIESKRNFNAGSKAQDRLNDYEPARNYRSKIEINKEDRMPIFFKKAESFPCLQAFLQGYNFRVWISESMIREDIESLRSLSRRPPIEDEPKKKKIKQQ